MPEVKLDELRRIQAETCKTFGNHKRLLIVETIWDREVTNRELLEKTGLFSRFAAAAIATYIHGRHPEARRGKVLKLVAPRIPEFRPAVHHDQQGAIAFDGP